MSTLYTLFSGVVRALGGSRYVVICLLLAGCAGSQPAAVSEQPSAGRDTGEAIESAPPGPAASPEEGMGAGLLYDLLVSDLAFQQGETELAYQSLMSAAKRTSDPLVIARAVRMAVHSQHYAQAVELGERWLRLAPEDYQAYLITALGAVMDQQGEKAEQILLSLLALDPAQAQLRFAQIGEVFLQHASGDIAQEVLVQLAQHYPDIPEAWTLLAGMAQRNRDFVQMNSALDTLLVLEPDNVTAATYKLLALEANSAEQLAFAQRFLQSYPDAAEFRMQYARLLVRLEDNTAALAQLLMVLRENPDNSDAANLTALLYQAREDYRNAAKYFVRRISLVPGDDRSRLYLGNAYQQLKRYAEAKKVLAQIESPDQQFAARRQMALVIEEADGAEAGLAYLNTIEPETPAQRAQLVIDQEGLLQRAGRQQEAYDLVSRTLIHDPNNETLRYHRALMAVERDDLAMHEADMRLLLTHKPDDPQYNNTLGYSLLVMSDRINEAEVLINKANRLKPDDPYILDSKGWLEFKLGNLAGALSYLNRAFEIDQDAEIAAHIGEVYWVGGEPEKAREAWAAGDKIDPDNRALKETKARFMQ